MIKNKPCNLDLEESILSAAFNCQDACDKVLSCEPEYFYVRRDVFQAMQRISEAGKLVNLVSLTLEMGNLKGPQIATIAQKEFTDVYLDQWINELKEIYYERTKQIAYESGKPEKLQTTLEAIELDKAKSNQCIVSNISNIALDYYSKGTDPGEPTGWPRMDKFYNISRGQITIITGIPSSGKSEWLDALTVNLATKGWKFVFFSPENFPVQRHLKKLVEKYSGFPFFEGYHQRISEEDLTISLKWIDEHYTFLNPIPDNRNIGYLLGQVKLILRSRHIDGFIIDPWNELEYTCPTNMTETLWISQCLMKIKAFSVSNNIHIWIVAHPTKLQKENTGKYPVPTLYDISGSANWYNKTDVGISIDRVYNEDSIVVHIQKVKFKDNGKRGRVRFLYDRITGSFSDVEA